MWPGPGMAVGGRARLVCSLTFPVRKAKGFVTWLSCIFEARSYDKTQLACFIYHSIAPTSTPSAQLVQYKMLPGGVRDADLE